MFVLHDAGDPTIVVHARSECFKTLEGHTEEVTAVAASPDGNFIVSGGLDNTIRTYKVTSV